ncbi:MAG TPA: hypothetical protein VJO99_07900 [Burkholderiaceae bacterium]|nr:hypothetical protein [Burkholderiaceae bacterium]
MHHLQSLIVALLVIGCSAYAAWALMPAVARRGLAKQLLRLRWPAPVATRLQRAASVSSGCGCDGCDAAAAPRANSNGGSVQKIVMFQRRR